MFAFSKRSKWYNIFPNTKSKEKGSAVYMLRTQHFERVCLWNKKMRRYKVNINIYMCVCIYRYRYILTDKTRAGCGIEFIHKGKKNKIRNKIKTK